MSDCCQICYECRVCRERMKAAAQKKPETKVIRQQLDAIAGDICQYICKFRISAKDENELYGICEYCPVSLLC